MFCNLRIVTSSYGSYLCWSCMSFIWMDSKSIKTLAQPSIAFTHLTNALIYVSKVTWSSVMGLWPSDHTNAPILKNPTPKPCPDIVRIFTLPQRIWTLICILLKRRIPLITGGHSSHIIRPRVYNNILIVMHVQK